jgi:pimeloyl-ACP methyl ester carboxylesterase
VPCKFDGSIVPADTHSPWNAMNEHITLQELSIETDEGRPIAADLRTPAPERELPLVIVCHGFLGYKRWGFFPYLSERVAAAGFHVLTFSFSLNGVDEETGRITRLDEFAGNTVTREIRDLERVCRFALGNGLPCPISDSGCGIVAHSRGAAVAILVAPRLPCIKSLVTLSTPSRLDRYSDRRKKLWKREGALVFADPRAAVPLRLDYAYYEDIAAHRDEFDLPRHASSLEIPHLMIHGERDAAVTVAETRGLYGERLAASARLEIIPGCSHTFGVTHPMKRPTRNIERAISLTEAFLGSTLRERTSEESPCGKNG